MGKNGILRIHKNGRCRFDLQQQIETERETSHKDTNAYVDGGKHEAILGLPGATAIASKVYSAMRENLITCKAGRIFQPFLSGIN